MSMSIEQLIDIVQADLTVSGLFEKILPDKEIKRIVKEHALEWFYKNYQFAVQQSYYYMAFENFKTDAYTQYKYFILPDEIENVTRIHQIDDPRLLHFGLQIPGLGLGFPMQMSMNQPLMSSYLSNLGELSVYRSVISAFADEINKMTKNTLFFNYNPINKRLAFLTKVERSLILRVYVRVEAEDMFDNQLFKDYVTGKSRIRLGETLKRFTFNMPGQFQYNSDELITQGTALVDSVTTLIAGQSNAGWFIMKK